MQIGGTLINAVVRILVLVATLAAVYVFLVRPVLDTTEKVSSGINGSIQQSINEANRALDQTDVSTHTQRVMTNKIKTVPTKDIPKLERCITNAGAEINAINRCIDRFSS